MAAVSADDVRAKFTYVEGSMSEELMAERRAEADRSAEYVAMRRVTVAALIRLINDRWTPPEVVLKQIKDSFYSAIRSADYELRAALVCENCGKTMGEHDGLAQCYPDLIDGSGGADG